MLLRRIERIIRNIILAFIAKKFASSSIDSKISFAVKSSLKLHDDSFELFSKIFRFKQFVVTKIADLVLWNNYDITICITCCGNNWVNQNYEKHNHFLQMKIFDQLHQLALLWDWRSTQKIHYLNVNLNPSPVGSWSIKS